jgi:hypothetical protein
VSQSTLALAKGFTFAEFTAWASAGSRVLDVKPR